MMKGKSENNQGAKRVRLWLAVLVTLIALAFPSGGRVAHASGSPPALPPMPPSFPPNAPWPQPGNNNDDKYFGDGYTTLDDTDWDIWLDWVIYFHWLPPHMNMVQQLTTTVAMQTMIVGTMFDAKNEQETQRLMQQLAAEAHRDYQPDMTMCTFGTNVRSLASTEALYRENTRYLDIALQKRDKLSANLAGADSIDEDLNDRFRMFTKIYCDVNDANAYLKPICGAGQPPARINNDVDWTKTIEDKYTLNVDFSTNVGLGTPDQQDVMALVKNLVGYRPFGKIGDAYLGQEFSKDTYLDMRSVEAMRSVARNSLAHIIGMRTVGPPIAKSSEKFMRKVLDQLQVPLPEIDKFLGQRPSYYAQMDILTHKIFESPEFFTNLYTTPANVERIGVTLQALTLMQNRDRYESSLRREMLLSLILELGIRERQEKVVNEVQNASNNLLGQTP
ncbi:MAG TPA: hypothetical protein VL625_02390 [Patescibacteria group bacterium]|nr:hypothetical protein [Patescibacteria group bacterium]